MEQYAIEMLHITKKFPGIIANDDITLQLKKGEIPLSSIFPIRIISVFGNPSS